MNHILKTITQATIITALVLTGIGCRKRVGPTTLYIQDPVRHYLPIVQGEDLRMNYLIVNTGRQPFIIQDIQPATLSIEFLKTPPRLIPVGDSANIAMVFHSDKNVGYVEHIIRIYGNVNALNDSAIIGEADILFDTHIVRPSIDQSDYEERYWEQKALNEKLVEGTRGEKGYYTDEDILENQLNENYEFYPNHNRDKQVQQTLEILHLK